MRAAKTLTALSLLHAANGSSRSASERRWKTVKERYTRSMNDALSAAKNKLHSDPAAAVKELQKFNQAYYSGPKTHKKGLSISERDSFQKKKEEARRLFQQAKMARASRKLQVLNKQGLGKSRKAQTLHKRMNRRFGY